MSKKTVCPRCGAPVELTVESAKRRKERERINGLRRSMGGLEETPALELIRAHKDPIDGRSCFAGGKSIDEMIERLAVHRRRLREAEERAREGAEYRSLHGDDAAMP